MYRPDAEKIAEDRKKQKALNQVVQTKVQSIEQEHENDQTSKTSEFAILHFINQYRDQVDKALRGLLGESYEKWERDEDEFTIPRHLII